MTGGSRAKRVWQRVDGVLLLDKAGGVTSNAALQGARRLFAAAKAGHTGTLDPMATGLLPVCFGDATKFSADLLEADKTYEADVLFGVRTNTGDADGMIVESKLPEFSDGDLASALAAFHGSIRQIPPMYSALKRDGRPLYELARKGIEVERVPREVTIHELTLLERRGDRCRLRVACSKGTYVRTLVEDIGSALGCGAHLTALRRTVVGSLRIGEAVTLDWLSATSDEARAACLLPVDALLQSLPAIHLDGDAALRFGHGNPVPAEAEMRPGKCRVYGGDERLIGVGEIDHAHLAHPRRLVSS